MGAYEHTNSDQGTTMKNTVRLLAAPALLALSLSGCVINLPDPEPETTQEQVEAEPTEEVTTTEVPEPTTERPTTTKAPAKTTATPDGTSEDGKDLYSTTPSEVFPLVAELCGLPDDVLADDGMTLILDTAGTDPDSGTLTAEDAGCAVGYLDPPDWLMQQIETTKFDGTRETAVDGYLSYSWTISNEEGLDFVVRASEEPA